MQKNGSAITWNCILNLADWQTRLNEFEDEELAEAYFFSAQASCLFALYVISVLIHIPPEKNCRC